MVYIHGQNNGYGIEFAIVMEKIDEVKTIIEEHEDVLNYEIGPSKLNILTFAVSMGKPEAAKYLIEYGMDVTWKSPENVTLLHASARLAGDPTVTRMLIEKGVDVNGRTESGLTPLLISAQQGHVEMAAILIANGADINAIDPESGSTPLHISLDRCYNEYASQLIELGADTTAMNAAGVPLLLYYKLPVCPGGSVLSLKSVAVGGEFIFNNPNEFPVLIGFQSGEKGYRISIPAKGEDKFMLPTDEYVIYGLYTNDPGVVYKINELSVKDNPRTKIKLSKTPSEKYGIFQPD
ncbi:ankyrin repeat domain-containing protein [Candidatus Neomarinimicrobiota bacterium]